MDLFDVDQVPERLQLGADCFTAIAAKLARVAAEQQHRQHVSFGTDH